MGPLFELRDRRIVENRRGGRTVITSGWDRAIREQESGRGDFFSKGREHEQ